MRARRILFPVLAIALSLVATGTVFEIALRALKPSNIRLFPRYHEAVRYGEYTLRRTRPSSRFVHTSRDGRWAFKTNAQGFRSERDYSYQKAPGVRRILVLGDSQALGYENAGEDILPARLERELGQRGLRVEVINSGVSGFGTAEELIFLEQEGIRYDPDIVVLMLFKNDFADNVRSGLFAIEGGRLVAKSKSYAPGTAILSVINSVGALRWLSENSYLYSFAFNGVWNAAKEISNRDASRDPFERTVAQGEIPPHQKLLMDHILRRMSDFAAARNVPLVIVDIPNPPPGGKVDDFETSLPSGEATALAGPSVPILSSEPILSDYRGRAAFHRPHGERHITPFVHAKLAFAIAEEIRPLLDDSGRANANSSPRQ